MAATFPKTSGSDIRTGAVINDVFAKRITAANKQITENKSDFSETFLRIEVILKGEAKSNVALNNSIDKRK